MDISEKALKVAALLLMAGSMICSIGQGIVSEKQQKIEIDKAVNKSVEQGFKDRGL